MSARADADDVERPSTGGLWPPTATRPRALSGWWIAPLPRVAVTGDLFSSHARGYSTPSRPRNVAGQLSLSCEGREGRTCGDSVGLAEAEAFAGYGPWLASGVRVRLDAAPATAVALDRLYVTGELGPVAAEVGRDVIVLGPQSHTQLGWSTNAPPLDHVRLSTRAPVSLTPRLAANALWIVGRLRAPQTYTGNLASINRVQLDIDQRVEIGAMQLLQLGGEGAELDAWEFLAEHVHRKNASAGATDSSNRRFGGDVTVRAFGGRAYYAVIFEDIRRRYLVDAIRRDADHLLGFRLRGFLVELVSTGVRSHEHIPRVTGFTNAGRIVGSPLGPDALSLYLRGRACLGPVVFHPWGELARLDSDTYEFIEDGPIRRTTRGRAEVRYRAGVQAWWPLSRELAIEAEPMIEYVDHWWFSSDEARLGGGVRVSLVWHGATLWQ